MSMLLLPLPLSLVQLVIKTCHRRGIHAIGGMAAQIPIKSDPAANQVRFLVAFSSFLPCYFTG